MNKCVLVVEDDALLRMDAVDIVEGAGFEAIEAASADEAILNLESYPAIAYVLTDIEMPGSMNGMALTFAVRDRWPPGDDRGDVGPDRAEGGRAGRPRRFIPKPYQPNQIHDALMAPA